MQAVAPILRNLSRNLVRFDTMFQQNFEFYFGRKIYFIHFRPHSEPGCLDYYLNIVLDYLLVLERLKAYNYGHFSNGTNAD